MFFHPQTKACV